MVVFSTTAESQASSLAREKIVPLLSVGPVEVPKSAKVLYILIEAELENKIDLLRGERKD